LFPPRVNFLHAVNSILKVSLQDIVLEWGIVNVIIKAFWLYQVSSASIAHAISVAFLAITFAVHDGQAHAEWQEAVPKNFASDVVSFFITNTAGVVPTCEITLDPHSFKFVRSGM